MEKAKGDEEVEEATETANATAVKKKNIFKKIFQPWKWKTKKKSKLKTKVAIFERKISVRVSQRGKRQGLEVVGEVEGRGPGCGETSWVEEVGVLPPPSQFAAGEVKEASVEEVQGAEVARMVARLERSSRVEQRKTVEEQGKVESLEEATARSEERERIKRRLEEKLLCRYYTVCLFLHPSTLPRPSREEVEGRGVLARAGAGEDRRRVSARLERRLSARPSAAELRGRNILRSRTQVGVGGGGNGRESRWKILVVGGGGSRGASGSAFSSRSESDPKSAKMSAGSQS